MGDYYTAKSKIFIVKKFIGHGKDLYMLANTKGAFTEDEIGQLAHQLIKALMHLHSKGIRLKTLRPQNLVFTSGFEPGSKCRLKITDIGLTHLLNLKNPNRAKTISGVDRLFIAPELYNGADTIDDKISKKSDIWSLGAILYIIITGGVNNKMHVEKFDF